MAGDAKRWNPARGKFEPVGKPSAPPSAAFTAAELAQHNGVTKKTIYVSINSIVYDVSVSPELYGPSGGYNMLDVTQRECWRSAL